MFPFERKEEIPQEKKELASRWLAKTKLLRSVYKIFSEFLMCPYNQYAYKYIWKTVCIYYGYEEP